ncbi:MAG: hypothetical protein IKH59_10660 [Bacteroidaceae bacterium]|nr:hypothetical protein [Prevotella sp.]MBR2098030.1 hypothetical protein [Prevotella sp.]MBR3022805.1 hypothetical protein [Bacteroidaceae bacterium]
MKDLNTVPSNGTYGAAIALVNQNFTLVKEQLEHLLYMREGFCGMYETSAALLSAHPNPVAGSFAYVGRAFPMAVYMVSNGSWYATQETYDGGDIDLTQYATSTALTALAGRVTALEGAGYLFAGVASPAASINLNGNTSKIFLLAFAPGTYTNYGGLTLSDGEIGVLYFNGSTWRGNKATDIMAKGIVGGYDETPTEDSEKPITSGGVFDALNGLRQEFNEGLSEVNPQFATGEKVGAVSIVSRPGSGTDAVMTQAAVSGTVFNEIAIDDIDDIIFNGGQLTPNPAFAGSESGVPAYYTVYDGTSHKLKVGVMSVISDNMGHVVTQVMATHYVLDDSGQITGAHSDSDLFLIYRSAKLSGGTLPTEVGDWTPWNYVNNSLLTNAIASIRTDLLGYYLKTETYSKEQVNALIDAINQFEYAVVAQLPTASSSTRHKIYLVPSTNPDTSNVKDEFITITTTQNGVIRYSWEQIGSTTVDLGGYSTTAQMNSAISSAVAAETALRVAADNLLDGRVTALEKASASLQESIDGEAIARENAVSDEASLREEADTLLDGRVGTLESTIAAADDVPTAGSDNLVKSGGVADKTNKVYYRSIFQPSATGSLIGDIDRIIKELYISPADLGEDDASKFCIQNIRRNVNGTWYVNLYFFNEGEGTQRLRFNSQKQKGEVEVIRTSNESYCVVDWSQLEDGGSVYIAPSKVSDYLLNGDYVTDIDNFPISKDATRLRSAEGNIGRLNTSVNNLTSKMSSLERNTFPFATAVGKFIRTNGSVGTAGAAQIMHWCMTDLIPLDYFVSANSVFFGTTEDIVLKNCYCRPGSDAPYCLFFDEEKNVITAPGGYIMGESESKADVTLSWGDNIPENAKYVRINFHSDGYIENLNPSSGGGTSSSVDEEFVEKFNKYAVSWVDDDFKITEESGEITENYPAKIKIICDELSGKCDFAVIPTSDGNWSGSNYPTNDTQVIPQYKADIIKAWQREGFHFQLHPIHKGWYTGGSQGYTYQGAAFCEQSLVKCIEAFRDAGIFNDSCVVYPGSSGTNSDVVGVIKNWVEFALTATTDNDPYNAEIKNPFNIRRMFLNFGSSTRTVDYYKAQVDAAFAAGAWIIFGTHSAQAVDDLDNPTSDTSALTLSNIKKVVQYALSKSQGITIQPLRKVWNGRKLMLGLWTGNPSL